MVTITILNSYTCGFVLRILFSMSIDGCQNSIMIMAYRFSICNIINEIHAII